MALTAGKIPIATDGTHATDGPLAEDGAGGVLLDGPTGTVNETYFGIVQGAQSVYLGVDVSSGYCYFYAFGGPMLIQSDANLVIVRGLGFRDYVDDAAAAADGVPIEGLYRTGSIVKVRVS